MARLKLSPSAINKLKSHAFPGNIRELKAAVELACVMAEDQIIEAEDITFYEMNARKAYQFEEKTLKEYELEIIEYYLKKYDKNVVQVAKKLDISKSKVYSLLQEQKILV